MYRGLDESLRVTLPLAELVAAGLSARASIRTRCARAPSLVSVIFQVLTRPGSATVR